MTLYVLTADGANIGTPPASYTEADKEHLAVLVQVFRVKFTNVEVKVFIITKYPDFNAWQPTQHRVVELARELLKELIADGKISLKPQGLYLGRPAPDDSTPHPELAQHYFKQGYNVQDMTRGQQDHIACALMRQQFRLVLASGRSAAPAMTTFEVALPATFALLSTRAKELIALCKTVIMGLGGAELEPKEVVVHTTLADTEKWPLAYVRVVDLARNFIKDQMDHNRVTLLSRPEGSAFGTGNPRGGKDDSDVGAGPVFNTTPARRLPETFVDLVDCLFEPEKVVKNHIVDIARMSMELSGNQSLQPAGFGQFGGSIPAPGTPALAGLAGLAGGSVGFETAASSPVRSQVQVLGSDGSQESDAPGGSSFHTAHTSRDVAAADGNETPPQAPGGPPGMFSLQPFLCHGTV